jgi:FkbM family methyltransferase
MLISLPEIIQKYNLNIKGVLHCGASYAQERYTYDELGIPEVVWIEAIPEVFEIAKANLIPFPKQVAIKACLSNEDGVEVKFNISNNESQSSSDLELGHHTVIHPEVHYVDKIILKTTRLDTLFNLLGKDIRHLNFLNCDLQGAELHAIDGMGKLLNQFDYLYLEVNKKETYRGCPLVEDIDNYLVDFERVETGTWVAGTWTDALYIRKTLL